LAAGNPHYALNFVVREDRKDDRRILHFVSIYRSSEVKAFILDHHGTCLMPVWWRGGYNPANSGVDK
jgi:ABC-type metal ion transport system substrate-binding protein